MTASRRPVVGAAALVVVLLVVGVVVTRGRTAADEQDVRAASRAQEATVSAPAQEVTVLDADGLPGLRLGGPGDDLASLVGPLFGRGPLIDPEDLPGGCDIAQDLGGPAAGPGWGVLAWVVDGTVASVLVSAQDDATQGASDAGPVTGPVTWLGPTLGSPVREAADLPGARTRVERPLGDDGPAVTVVELRRDGVDTVWSDVRSPGRIGTVEVRLPVARRCSVQALQQRLDELEGLAGTASEPVLLGRDGLAELPLGMPVAELVELPRVLRQEGDGSGRCSTYWYVDDRARASTVKVADSVVVSVEPAGPVRTDLGVATGDGLDDVVRAFPELSGRVEELLEQGSADVERDGRGLTLRMWPETGWVPDVELPVEGGGPVLQRVGVREAGTSTAVTC